MKRLRDTLQVYKNIKIKYYCLKQTYLVSCKHKFSNKAVSDSFLQILRVIFLQEVATLFKTNVYDKSRLHCYLFYIIPTI